MKVNKDWWKRFFNEIYLITDARSVLNPALTRQEVRLIEGTLQLNKADEVLDLCGGCGRHSLELARRGHRNLTVLDFSDYLIRLGRKMARQAGLKVKFLRRDARYSGLKNESFSAVMVMANSFGYFPDEKENLRILQEIHRLLKAGGRMLLDLTDADYARKNLKPFSWHRANKDVLVLRHRQLQGDIVKAREMVISKHRGLLRDGFYCERLYNNDKIARLLKRAGFKSLSIQNNLSLHKARKDFGLLTKRMLVAAVK